MSESERPNVSVGDLVLAAGESAVPVGEVEVVLPTSRGTQLVLKRAFFPGAFVATQAGEIEFSEDDPELGLRWHRLGIPLETILSAGRFRRVMGRLTPDSYPSAPPPRLDDAAAAASIAQALAEDPLIGAESSEIDMRVFHGAASLRGWVRLVGSKVVAEHLARSTPGVWYVRNWLFSDEELLGAVQRWLRSHATAGTLVRDVRMTLGRATIALSRPAAGAAQAALLALTAEPGIRGVELREQSGN